MTERMGNGLADAPLVIEYVFEGDRRGYNFTTPTHRYSESVVKTIWQNAMPKGQGWGQYTGAETLKCFPLPDGRIAASRVVVTDREDESGRKGIRRAEISVLSQGMFRPFLQNRLNDIPENTQRDAELQIKHWRTLKTLERLPRKAVKSDQLVLTHAFRTLADWRFMEALVLKLALEPLAHLRRWSKPFALTTLALLHAGESPLVAVPLDKLNLRKANEAAVIEVR